MSTYLLIQQNSKDEFLLTLMKLRLRLALLNQDLAEQLEICERLVTKVIHSWLKAMAEYLNAFVYMYGIENILATTHQRYRQLEMQGAFSGITFISRAHTGRISDKKLKFGEWFS